MGARYPFYILADSREGQLKEAEIARVPPRNSPIRNNISHGFVYERMPKITLGHIANNLEIDVIWGKWNDKIEGLRRALADAMGQEEDLKDWEIPRELPDDWNEMAGNILSEYWKARYARQNEINASIESKADPIQIFDRPYEDKKKVRVAGPFTVESASPHRMLHVDENDEVIDTWQKINEDPGTYRIQDFTTVILENLKTAGVQQAHKEDRITFTSITPFPGKGHVCAEATYVEGDSENAPTRRAAIFIGPEFGTVSRPDLVEAAREAGDLNCDVLIACAFNYDAHSSEFERLGKIPVLKARMNADLHMADDLKNTGKGNLFVIFGEPDISIQDAGNDQITVRINGVDVFKPNTGEVVSSGPDGIACWFIDSDYNEESFFVRQAYFLGQNDPYKSLKTTLKAEIDEEAWSTLNSATSRPFPKPSTGRIAVKVINHLGDEVMKVFSV
jgi:adenine-specific DNA-methyltransferase